MLRITLGDITKIEADAIVNAANTSLLGGGGVDGAIHRAAGPKLLAECRMLSGCKTGQAKITKGYQLPAKYVIHTLAAEHGCRTVAFPSISTGIYRFPLEKASIIAVGTILEFLVLHPDMDVQMICWDRETFQYYKNALAMAKNK